MHHGVARDTLRRLSDAGLFASRIWNYLGVSHAIFANFEEAVVCFETQVAKDPRHRVAWSNLAFARAFLARREGKLNDRFEPLSFGVKNGRHPEVVKAVSDALRAQLEVAPPVKHGVHILLGLLEERVGMNGALHFAHALRQCPPCGAEALYFWGRMERRRALKAPAGSEASGKAIDSALAVLGKLVSMFPGTKLAGRGYLELARTHVIMEAKGENDAVPAVAVDCFNKALKIDATRVHKWWGLAEMTRGHRAAEALRHFEIQMVIAPIYNGEDQMVRSARLLDPQWDERYAPAPERKNGAGGAGSDLETVD